MPTPKVDAVGREDAADPMFTLEQIDELHSWLGRAETLADYLRGLADLGVARFESFVADGHTEFFAPDGHSMTSSAHHEPLDVATTSDRAAFLEHLRRHADRETSYVEMSRGLAASGVEKWVGDTGALTMTYLDKAGEALLVQEIS